MTVFPLASIKSDEQLHEAHKVMDQLLAHGELKGGEEIYLDALSDLVAAYEDEHFAIEPASDADWTRACLPPTFDVGKSSGETEYVRPSQQARVRRILDRVTPRGRARG